MPKDPSENVGASPKGGIVLVLMGGAVIASAFVPQSRAPGMYAGYEAGLLQAAAGAGVAFLGAAWALWAWTRPPPPKAARSADAAFHSKSGQAAGVKDVVGASPAPGVVVPRAAPKVESMSELDGINLAIRDVTQRIGKAKVMLGTGKLSNEGYQKYMSELSRELAELEARRMKIETRQLQ